VGGNLINAGVILTGKYSGMKAGLVPRKRCKD
jgi:hypothetical protein